MLLALAPAFLGSGFFVLMPKLLAPFVKGSTVDGLVMAGSSKASGGGPAAMFSSTELRDEMEDMLARLERGECTAEDAKPLVLAPMPAAMGSFGGVTLRSEGGSSGAGDWIAEDGWMVVDFAGDEGEGDCADCEGVKASPLAPREMRARLGLLSIHSSS